MHVARLPWIIPLVGFPKPTVRQWDAEPAHGNFTSADSDFSTTYPTPASLGLSSDDSFESLDSTGCSGVLSRRREADTHELVTVATYSIGPAEGKFASADTDFSTSYPALAWFGLGSDDSFESLDSTGGSCVSSGQREADTHELVTVAPYSHGRERRMSTARVGNGSKNEQLSLAVEDQRPVVVADLRTIGNRYGPQGKLRQLISDHRRPAEAPHFCCHSQPSQCFCVSLAHEVKRYCYDLQMAVAQATCIPNLQAAAHPCYNLQL
ncbi:hypothetical protein C1H46_034091 [Malus baccata]|uniref:Uncharacterized protein n=1 Tax=Malus baccata TaxID=106549 RepID=A0A540L1N1_MALBA|nr:hypothetical protein C1H46_034091 [Malus baccata]